MDDPHGYHRQYLEVDVTTGTAKQHVLNTDVLQRTIGGSGLGTQLLIDHQAWNHDPLSAGASIVFAFSPLVGSPLTTSAKFAVVSHSPLTGRINDSLASSTFAIAGKRTGNDALLIKGRASIPSILMIDETNMELQPANELWGLSAEDAETILRKKFGNDYSFAVIGPAGEQLVRYATISHSGRHAGRGGSGAILGAKNIKAIAVRGTKRTAWYHGDALVEQARKLSRRSFGSATEKYRELGTAANVLVFNSLNCLPTRNFQKGSFEQDVELSPEALNRTREKMRTSCAACTIGCTHVYSVEVDGKSSQARIEYENLFALGPLCEVSDQQTVLQASQLCDYYGLDTISTGGTIAFAMECVEKGVLDEPWLRFGHGDAMLKAIHLIGQNKGLGKKLAKGSRAFANELGQNTIAFAPQVKGLELPGYEPRALQTMALGFAVGTRGADHNRSGAYEVDFSEDVDRRNAQTSQARLAVETEDKAALMDSLILCKFLRGVFDDYFAECALLLNLITGWTLEAKDLIATSKSIVNAKKQFNILSGWSPEEDTLPERMLTSALEDDRDASLNRETLEALVKAYNLERGWDEAGFLPTTSTTV
ncbi:MAG: aldehyde ferredoxin oxidoreductase C-terminal domain-containing protein [Planctomycetota bacterium]|nr:aldehyde ferredoxin oxidoreductase C-terminal domain-containing protein [Planctomycetota bacterium]